MRKTKKNINFRLAAPFLKYYFILNFFLLFNSFSSYAYSPKEGKINIAVGPFLHHGDFRSRPDKFYETYKRGFAIVAEANFSSKYALEVGIFKLNKPYLNQESNRYLIEEIERLYITTGVRRWWSSYFSTGINFFSSFSFGDPRFIDSNGFIDENFQTLATRETASVYGLDTSLRFEFDLSKKQGVFLDFRYSYSLSSKSTDEANHLAVGLFYSREVKVE